MKFPRHSNPLIITRYVLKCIQMAIFLFYLFAGTYDVIEMSAVPSINGIDIYFNFVQNTNSKGVLVVLIYVYNGIANFTRSVYSPVGRADANNGYFFNNISSGNYCIYVYDIEFDGHLQAFGSPALYNHSVLIRGSDEGM